MKLALYACAAGLLFSGVALADDESYDMKLRVGAAVVLPNDGSGGVLSASDGVAVDDGTSLAFSFEFPMSDRVSFEILAALPFAHDIEGVGTLDGLAIGEVEHLPPTFSALYYLDEEKMFHMGVGLNYTTFVSADSDPALTAALGATSTDLDLSDSFGIALKFGFDVPLSEDWAFSGSFYYMDIDTDADVIVNGNVAQTVDVRIDPFVAMIGVSTTF